MKKNTPCHFSSARSWDSVLTENNVVGTEDLWRAYMKEIYQGLQERWGKGAWAGRALKTDLYDEAVTPHNLCSLFDNRCDQFVATDVSFKIARAARKRMTRPWREASVIAVSDMRHLAFRSCVFDGIFSNSTLDHFADREDLMASLLELRRVMRPGGTLIITLDNPRNPIVFLRNRLPYRLLRFLGLIPFYMGVTLSEPELVRALELSGFRVCESTAIAHAPRIIVILVGRWLERRDLRCFWKWVHELLRMFKPLEGFPTKYVTGYYIAVKAVRE
jgi:SAM-dependent methyltransferase